MQTSSTAPRGAATRPWWRKSTFATHGLLLLGILIVLLIQASFMPGMPVWITDNGNKIMTAMRISGPEHTDTFAPSHLFPGSEDYFPGDFHFHRIDEDGTARSILPNTFPFLMSLTKTVFGADAFLFWPIAGTVLTFLLLALLLHSFRFPVRSSILCIVLAFLGAPFLFYSGTVWEMTISCTFPLAAFLLLRYKKPLLAGLILGAGIWLREECAIIALLTACAMLYTGYKSPKQTFKSIAFFSAGILCAGILLCAYNYKYFGHILGFHGSLYYTHNAKNTGPVPLYLRIIRGYWMYLFRFDGRAPLPKYLEIVFYTPLVLLPIAGAFHCRRIRLAALCGATVSWAALFICAICSPNSISYAGLNTGFIADSPLYAGFFLTWREQLVSRNRLVRAGALIAFLYCLIIPPMLTQTDIGVIWGARHFILLAPLFTLLSIYGFRLLRIPQFPMGHVVALLAVTASAFVLYGGYAVVNRAGLHDKVARALPGDVIVTDAFFLPEMTPNLITETQDILYVKSDGQFLSLLDQMRGSTDTFHLVLCSANPYYGFITDACLEKLNDMTFLHLEDVVQIKPDPESFMQFSVFRVRLDP